jgi:hypothetical protein
MKPQTYETLIQDQKERIERCHAPKGTNLIMDYINDINEDMKASQSN